MTRLSARRLLLAAQATTGWTTQNLECHVVEKSGAGPGASDTGSGLTLARSQGDGRECHSRAFQRLLARSDAQGVAPSALQSPMFVLLLVRPSSPRPWRPWCSVCECRDMGRRGFPLEREQQPEFAERRAAGSLSMWRKDMDLDQLKATTGVQASDLGHRKIRKNLKISLGAGARGQLNTRRHGTR